MQITQLSTIIFIKKLDYQDVQQKCTRLIKNVVGRLLTYQDVQQTVTRLIIKTLGRLLFVTDSFPNRTMWITQLIVKIVGRLVDLQDIQNILFSYQTVCHQKNHQLTRLSALL